MNAQAKMPWRLLLAAGAASIATGGTVVASVPTAEAAAEPPLKLVASARTVTLTHAEDQPIWLDPGVHVVAGGQPFEVWARRASYAAPIRAERAHVTPGGKRMEALPVDLVTSLAGLPEFIRLTVKDRAGDTVLEVNEDFCPNHGAVRARRGAPASSPYPESCSANPFALGAVWGIQEGWGVPAAARWWQREPLHLPDGRYTAEVRINDPYARALDIPASHASTTVEVRVRTVAGEPPLDSRRARPRESATRPAPQIRPHSTARTPHDPPRGRDVRRPDLRALPAWDVRIGDLGDPRRRDRLSFNATVWTAGESPLVVEGFRKANDVMDAYQYFYDERGGQLGHERIGTLEWDDRSGHQQWRLPGFATYRLLDADMRTLTTMTADPACVLDTDAIDHTIRFASWQPWKSEPRAVCGDRTALAVRGVLSVGSGFTQAQLLPDQTFDISTHPNGTYYIQVVVNPGGHLVETDASNNSSLRRIILGGRPGARTVDVPPYQEIVG